MPAARMRGGLIQQKRSADHLKSKSLIFLFCGQPPGIVLRIVVDAISFAVAFSLCMQALLSVARSLFFPRKGPA